jgi:hypothetical protein
LLRLFLDSEATAFAARFEVAAERITDELSSLESSLDSSIKSMSDQLGWADYQLGDTESTLDSIQGLIAKLTVDTDNVNSRLRALFRQDEREDPVRKKARVQYVNRLIEEIKEDEGLFAHVVAGGNLTTKGKQPEDSDITGDDVKQLLDIAVRHVHNTERDKNYLIVVKAPKDCTDAELNQFAEKVADGGEVADGISERAKRAFRLGFIVYGDVIVGTAALKCQSVQEGSQPARPCRLPLRAWLDISRCPSSRERSDDPAHERSPAFRQRLCFIRHNENLQ